MSLPYLDAIIFQGFEDEEETPDCVPALACSPYLTAPCLHTRCSVSRSVTVSGYLFHRPPFPLATKKQNNDFFTFILTKLPHILTAVDSTLWLE